jgi:hypothetical protein
MAAWPGWRPGTWHTNTVDRVNVSAVGLTVDLVQLRSLHARVGIPSTASSQPAAARTVPTLQLSCMAMEQAGAAAAGTAAAANYHDGQAWC